jgi:hypothetical protein
MGFDAEDKRKLHAEVNQLVNQRFLLNTAAITIFGIIMAWTMSRPIQTIVAPASDFISAVSTLLTLLLFSLYILSHLLRRTTRVITTYLIAKSMSEWEEDWQSFRSSNTYFAYTKSQTILFLSLGLLSSTWPYLFGLIMRSPVVLTPVLWFSTIIGFIYVVLISGMGFFNWWYQEKSIEDQWKCVLKQKQDKA